MRCGVRCTGRAAGGRGAWCWKRHARGEGPTRGLGDKARARTHVEHAAHVLDSGRVEVQRPVERRRILPSRGGRACDAEREARAGRPEGVKAG